MKRIIYGSLGFLGILMGITLVTPLFWDINDYKPQLLAKAKEILKRDVNIDGKLSLSLLPSPRISIERVRISNLAKGSPRDFLHTKQLQVFFSILPLLKKQINIKTIILEEPEIFLEKLGDGQMNWRFTLSQGTPLPSTQQNTQVSASQEFGLGLDKIEIKNGHLFYHQEEKDIEIRGINLTATLDLPQGFYTVAGKLNAFDQDIKVKSNVRTLGDAQEVNFEMQAGDMITVLKGQALLASLTFKGALKTTAPPDAFRNPLEIKWPLNLSGPLQINAAVAANPDSISLNAIRFDTESLHSTGDIEISVKNDLRVEGTFKDLPGHGHCQFALSQSPKGLSGSVQAAVPNAKDLLNFLRIDPKNIPANLLKNITFSTQYSVADAVRLENMNFNIKDARLKGNASWKVKEDFSLVTMDIESPRIDAIFKLFNIKAPQILRAGSGSAHGKISGNLNTLKLDTRVSLGKLGLNLKGIVSAWQKAPEFDLHVSASHPSFKELLGNSAKAARGSAENLQIDSHLQGNRTYFKAANLKGKLGSDASFSGDVVVDYTGVKPNIKASLSTGALNADILLASTQGGIYQPHPAVAKVHLIAAKRRKADSQPRSRWSREPLDFSFLSAFDGQLDLSTSKLIKKNMIISPLKLTAKIQNDRLNITRLEGSIFGGELKGGGYLTANNDVYFNGTVKDANLSSLFTRPGKIKIVEGKTSFSGDFSTHGHSMEQMVQHLTGPVSIQANNGAISGFDLNAVSHHLGNLKDLQSLLGFLSTAMEKGKTSFSNFEGNIIFKEGIGTIQSMNLITKGGQGHASGYINLPRYALDIHAEFRLTEHPNFPPFSMQWAGDLDNPSRKLDTSALEKYMMENIFKNVIRQVGKGKFNIPVGKDKLDIPNILGGILGGR